MEIWRVPPFSLLPLMLKTASLGTVSLHRLLTDVVKQREISGPQHTSQSSVCMSMFKMQQTHV